MSDIFDRAKRSDVMSKVRSKKNKSTELRLIKIFRENGMIGWRRNYRVKGHPDFVFLNKKVAFFVDGCFWHGHDCRNTTPEQNGEFWKKKIARNKERDNKVSKLFLRRGWKVLRIWECELKRGNRETLLARFRYAGIGIEFKRTF